MPTAATVVGLLLDVGGPLLRLPYELLDEVERNYGLPPGTIRWRGPFDPGSDSLWRDRQAGRISEGAYWIRRAEEVERAAGRAGGSGTSSPPAIRVPGWSSCGGRRRRS